jgi:hypothetical protein
MDARYKIALEEREEKNKGQSQVLTQMVETRHGMGMRCPVRIQYRAR